MAISGNLTYDYYLSVPKFSDGDFLNTVKQKFSDAEIYGREDREECFRYIHVVENFLHGGKTAFGCQRCMI